MGVTYAMQPEDQIYISRVPIFHFLKSHSCSPPNQNDSKNLGVAVVGSVLFPKQDSLQLKMQVADR